MSVQLTLPWPTLIQFGIGELGLDPDKFWQLTLIELNAIINACSHSTLPTHHELEHLISLTQRKQS